MIITAESPPQLTELQKQRANNTVEKIAITKTLLAADRKRAADVLLQLHYQLSRTTSSITIK